ncbi:hypothetical protein, unknown function [Leishmania tarentolae]|uniref:Uncharacterized protein n=1 Tax=Leishmania tarentolae TaxID=5689 RepID=A0A640KP83_LEITA|nr:hypothetical protein, unknown function [Leishmania tarentolae]
MRASAHRWRLGCVRSGPGARMLSTHTSHYLAALSFLLRDPQQFPVVIVMGRSFSAFTALYRVFPIAAYMMYNTDAMLARCTAFVEDDYPDLPCPSSVRLVPHTSALLGPDLCEKSGTYMDVMRAAAEPLSGADNVGAAELYGSGSIASAIQDEELRQSITSSFTDQFIASIGDRWGSPSVRQSCRETKPMQPVGKLELRLQNDKFSHHGSIVSHHDTHDPALPRSIHWVVPRCLIDCKVDLRKAMDAWRSVLSRSRPGEVVSLVLFVNVDVVDVTALLGCKGCCKSLGSLFLKNDVIDPQNLCRASPPPYNCASCAAFRWPLRAPSQLRTALLSLPPEGSSVTESSSGCAGAKRGSADGLPWRTRDLEVPIVNCWDKEKSMTNEYEHHDLTRTVNAFQHLFSVVSAKHQVRHRYMRKRCFWHNVLLRIPNPLQRWQWVLKKDSSPYPVPPLDAGLSRALPYTLVNDAEEKHRQQQRTVRRNAVDAATLQSLHYGDLSAASTANSARTRVPFPNPRYFTTLVSDAGALLVRDGCLSDLFVMEFKPALLEVTLSSHYWRLWHTKTLREITSMPLGGQRAFLELLSAGEKLVSAPMPSASLNLNVLKYATQFLYKSGRGRSVLAWPLTDPAEGYRCLRVAFTLSYEIYTDPRSLTHLRYAARGSSAMEAETHRLASAAGMASATAASAAGYGSAQPPLVIETLQDVISYILETMRKLGWVLVWQEDHRRWPTAVPPPCIHPHINTVPSAFPLSGGAGPAMQERIAASLERWRQEQLHVNNKRFDADVPAVGLEALSSHEAVESRNAAAVDPATATPYTSLDVWQAALIPEDAGVYLWEGQTVFFDDGRAGVIVEFRPPPSELFTPIEDHPTEAKRAYWRVQQEVHADFIRFYRWRLHCFAAVNPRHATAAFTSLPHYVRAREMTQFPVVELLHRVTNGMRPLVQVLPRRTSQYHVAYPRVCVVSVAEQKSWYEAQGQPVLAEEEFRDVVWRLSTTDADERAASEVTLLRLPLSPFRIEEASLPFVSRMMELSRHPASRDVQGVLRHSTTTKARQALFQSLNAKWATCHRNAALHDRTSRQRLWAVKGRTHISWRTLSASFHSSEALYFSFATANPDTVLHGKQGNNSVEMRHS